MNKDELIRVLASTRTDLNKARLVVMAVPGQLDHSLLEEHGNAIEHYQANALHGLEKAVDNINELLTEMGGKA
jgi:hypothetical protein